MPACKVSGRRCSVLLILFMYACVLRWLLRQVSDWVSALQLPANAMVVYENAEDVITAQGEPEQVKTGSGTAGAPESGVCGEVWVDRPLYNSVRDTEVMRHGALGAQGDCPNN